MQIFTKKWFFYSMLFLFFSPFCYAGWPSFKVPEIQQVLALVESCGNGLGKIPVGSKITIVGPYVPHNWFWKYHGDGQCHPIENLTYVDYQPPGLAVFSGGVIKTFYGVDGNSFFAFDFVVPQGSCPDGGCPWDCGPFYNNGKLPIKIGCAQDQHS